MLTCSQQTTTRASWRCGKRKKYSTTRDDIFGVASRRLFPFTRKHLSYRVCHVGGRSWWCQMLPRPCCRPTTRDQQRAKGPNGRAGIAGAPSQEWRGGVLSSFFDIRDDSAFRPLTQNYRSHFDATRACALGSGSDLAEPHSHTSDHPQRASCRTCLSAHLSACHCRHNPNPQELVTTHHSF